MLSISNIEDLVVEYSELLNSFKYLSKHFESYTYENFSSIIKYDKELDNELKSYYSLYYMSINHFIICIQSFEKK